MSSEMAALRFSDGKIMYWELDSCFYPHSELYETMADYRYRRGRPLEDVARGCTCGRDEPVELYLSFVWPGRACRYCRWVTDFGDFTEIDDETYEQRCRESPDEPDWLCWDANIEPTSGGEAAQTLAYWQSLSQVLHESPYLEPRTLDVPPEDREVVTFYTRVAESLRGVQSRIREIDRGNVTPDLIAHADDWAQYCQDKASVCDKIVEISRTRETFMKWGRGRNYWRSVDKWVDAAHRAIVTGGPAPADGPVIDEVHRFEEEDSARREQAFAELENMKARAKRLIRDSFLLCLRLTKQHDQAFQDFRLSVG